MRIKARLAALPVSMSPFPADPAQWRLPFRRDRGGIGRHRTAMREGVLKIVGDVSRRVAAVPTIDAPLAGGTRDHNAVRTQLADDLHDQGRDRVAGHAAGLRRNRRRVKEAAAELKKHGSLCSTSNPGSAHQCTYNRCCFGAGWVIPFALYTEGKSMSIEISREVEARLTDEAKRLGISVDALLQRFIGEHAALTRPPQSRPELPVWHLGAGALHRRDIYDDVR